MLARAAGINDPEVAKLLKEKFVCYGRDNLINLQATDAELKWLDSRMGYQSTGGMDIFTAGGQVLWTGLSRDPASTLNVLNQALSKYQPEEAPQIDKPGPKELAEVIRRPFEGGLNLLVTYTVLVDKNVLEFGSAWGPKPDPMGPSIRLASLTGRAKYMAAATMDCPGLEHLWARKDEADALVKGEFTDKLKQRLALHIAYGLGEARKVKATDLSLHDGRVTGSFLMENGERADVLGFVKTKDGKISQFEMIVKGIAIGGYNLCGGLGPLTCVAKGQKAPVAIAFMLTDPNDVLSRVPPHTTRDLDRPEIKGRR
jgi:hypothetical protein